VRRLCAAKHSTLLLSSALHLTPLLCTPPYSSPLHSTLLLSSVAAHVVVAGSPMAPKSALIPTAPCACCAWMAAHALLIPMARTESKVGVALPANTVARPHSRAAQMPVVASSSSRVT
jgi:hypothetical protein